jgi:hypothetical protein
METLSPLLAPTNAAAAVAYRVSTSHAKNRIVQWQRTRTRSPTSTTAPKPAPPPPAVPAAAAALTRLTRVGRVGWRPTSLTRARAHVEAAEGLCAIGLDRTAAAQRAHIASPACAVYY